MARSGQTNRPQPPEDDFIVKHGRRIVVIVFSILAGDAIPVIIQHGISPNRTFYTIVAVTLPYTGALVLIFLAMATMGRDEHPYAHMALAVAILMLCFGLGAQFRLGITETELNDVMQQINDANHPYPRPAPTQPQQVFNAGGIIIKFYFTKYGPPTFVAATLAAIVITWNILVWHDSRAQRP